MLDKKERQLKEANQMCLQQSDRVASLEVRKRELESSLQVLEQGSKLLSLFQLFEPFSILVENYVSAYRVFTRER